MISFLLMHVLHQWRGKISKHRKNVELKNIRASKVMWNWIHGSVEVTCVCSAEWGNDRHCIE